MNKQKWKVTNAPDRVEKYHEGGPVDKMNPSLPPILESDKNTGIKSPETGPSIEEGLSGRQAEIALYKSRERGKAESVSPDNVIWNADMQANLTEEETEE